MGRLAGRNLSSGCHNNFFGYYAGCSNTTGHSNNFLGNCAGCGNNSGANNNFFGSLAGNANNNGSYNNFFGTGAGQNNDSGSCNVFIGLCAGYSNTSSTDNFFGGTSAGCDNTTGNCNVFVGRLSGCNNTTGCQNTFVGPLAGSANISGCRNTFLGVSAGTNSTASDQVAIGYNTKVAAPTENTQLAIGVGNTNWINGNESYFVGFGITNPVERVDIGGNLQLSGELRGPANFVIDPAAVGDNTGVVRIKGDLYVDGDNFIVNSETITLGDFVVGIASTVPNRDELDGAGIGIGSDVTFLYDDTNTALKSNVNLNVTSGNTYKINGTNVLSATTLGSGVVNSSLTSVGNLTSLTVSGNINANGNIVGDTATNISNINTVTATTGNLTTLSVSGNINANGNIVGDGSTNISGINDISAVGVVTATDFNSTSDQKLKTNIQRVENAVDKVQQIDGVSFNWIENDKPSMGVIADQVEKVLPELVSNTDPKTVNYNGLIGLLIEVVKEQQTQINDLNERLSRLE
jgi:hypothetical protein